MLRMYYILEGGVVRPAQSLDEWAEYFSKDRVIARDSVGKLTLSTVFLGIDHSTWAGEPPVLFESMVFGLEDERMERYCTLDEARVGHARLLKELQNESR